VTPDKSSAGRDGGGRDSAGRDSAGRDSAGRTERVFADCQSLAAVARAAFGTGRRLSAVTRLADASKKGVYRAAFTDGFTAVVYIWADAENYWPALPGEPGGHADPFSPSSDLPLFRAAHARLESLGIQTPQVYLADSSREHYPADIAVIEDVPGPTLETLLSEDRGRAIPVLERLAAALGIMHATQAPAFGKVAPLDAGSAAGGASCEQVVLDRALANLAEASARDGRVGRARPALEQLLRRRAAAVRPRRDYRLIHGELGPDHVLVDGQGRPVIIDIDGLMFFDVEWEHVFLELRFGDDYRFLRRPEIDAGRLSLYRLAMHLSLVAGPLRLLDGDYPDREPMLGIAEANIRRTLADAKHPS
jgi:Phosphotransferase enzyme family